LEHAQAQFIRPLPTERPEVADSCYISRSTTCFFTTGHSPRITRVGRYHDPFELLTGLASDKTSGRHAEQFRPPPPFVALLGGPYGTGKTELGCRLQGHLGPRQPQLLAVSLSLCRPHRQALDRVPASGAFAAFLFGHLRRPAANEVLPAEVRRGIRTGEIIL